MTKPFDPIEYLKLAQRLSAHSQDEACLRAAVSRGYYAVFLMVRERTKGFSNDTSHRGVQKALKTRSRYASSRLASLHRLRKVADYDLTPPNLDDRDWIKNWSDANALINSLLPDIPRIN